MPSAYQTFPIEFRGGLISNKSKLQQGIQDIGSASILENFEANKEGGYSKLLGYSKFGSVTVPGEGPILSMKVISSGRVVVGRKVDSQAVTDVTDLVTADIGKTAYYYGTGGSTFTYMGVSASANGGKGRTAEFNLSGDDKVIFVDGTNYPAIYNTSGNTITFLTSSDSSDVSGADNVAFFKNTAFYSNGTNIYFTAPFSVDDFSAANGAGTINVGSEITGLTVFRDQLIIFTIDTIKRLTGNTAADFQLSPITERIGCINGDTIQEVGGDIMYLAPDGLRLLSATDRIGDFGLGIPSDKITRDASTFLNITSDFCSVIVREKAQYRIFAYVSSELADTAKGLIATKFEAQSAEGFGWSTTRGIKAYVADSVYNEGKETIMFGNSDGYVYRMETGKLFDGENIKAIYESPAMPISDPQTRKSFYKMTLFLDPTGGISLGINLKFDFDGGVNSNGVNPGVIQPDQVRLEAAPGSASAVFFFGSSSATFGTATFGGDLDKIYEKFVIGSGKTVALRIEDTSDNPTFKLDTAILEYRQHDRQ